MNSLTFKFNYMAKKKLTDEEKIAAIKAQFETLNESQQGRLQGFENHSGKDLQSDYAHYLGYVRRNKAAHSKENEQKVYNTVNDGANELSNLNDMAVAIQSEEWSTEGLTYIQHKLQEVADLVEKKIQSNKEKEIEDAKKAALDAISKLNQLSEKDYKLSE